MRLLVVNVVLVMTFQPECAGFANATDNCLQHKGRKHVAVPCLLGAPCCGVTFLRAISPCINLNLLYMWTCMPTGFSVRHRRGTPPHRGSEHNKVRATPRLS